MGDVGSIHGLGRSPGEGKGYPLQYFGLEKPVDCIVHGVAKGRTWLSDFHSPCHHHQFPWHKHYLLCITKQKYCIDPVHWSNEPYHKSKSLEQQCWSRTASGGFSHCYVSRKDTHVGFSPCQFQTKTLRRWRTALWLTQPHCTPHWPALPFPVLL